MSKNRLQVVHCRSQLEGGDVHTRLVDTAAMTSLLASQQGAQDNEIADQNKEFPATLSTETPVWRVGGIFGEGAYEVLEHTSAAIDSTYMSVLPVLKDHDQTEQIGIVSSVALQDRKLQGTLKFSRTEDGNDVATDVEDGIRKSLSVGYVIMQYARKIVDGVQYVFVKKWMPLEVSVVAVPADYNAGFFRSAAMTTTAQAVEVVEEQTEQVEQVASTESVLEVVSGENLENTTDTNTNKEPAQPEVVEQKQEVQSTQSTTESVSETVPEPVAEAPAETASETVVEVQEVDTYEATANEIRQLAAELKVPETLVNDSISARHSTDAFMDAVRSFKQTPSIKTTKTLTKENQMINFLQAARRDAAAVETSAELAGRNSKLLEASGSNAILVPMSRTLTTTGTGTGAELVSTAEGTLIDALFPQTRLFQLGVQTLSGLTSDLMIPKFNGGATAQWIGENPSSGVSASTPGTDKILLKPKTLMAKVYITRQQLATAGNKDVEALVRADIMRQFAAAIDSAAFNGSSDGDAPVGLWNTVGVNTQSLATVDAKNLRAGFDKIIAANANFANLAAVTSVEGASVLKDTLKNSVAGATTLWEGEGVTGKILGTYDGYVSNLIAKDKGTGTNEHVMIAGDFSQFIFAQFGDAMSIEMISDENLASKGLVCLVAVMMCDFGVRHPQSFVKFTGFVPA